MSEKQDYSSIATPVYEVPAMPPPVVVHQPVIVQQPYVPPNLPLIIPNVYSPPPVPAGNGVIVQQISDGDQNVIRINIQPQQQGQQMQFQPQHVQQVYSNPQVNNNREPMINRQKQEEDDGDCAQGCADCVVMSCRIFLVIFTFGLCLGVLAQRSMN